MKPIQTVPVATVALLIALVAAGCAAADPGSGAASGSDSGSGHAAPLGVLSGRTFYSTAVSEAGAPRVLAKGTRISLEFSADSLAANAGCNSLGGEAAYTKGTLVTAKGLSMTEMGCDQARMEQDSWLVGVLTKTPDLTLDGDQLTLTSGDTQIAFLAKEAADPDVPLTGTHWVLESMGSGAGDEGTVSSVPAGVESTLAIGDDGRLTVRPGCNSGGGEVEIVDGTLKVGPLLLTLMACGRAEAEVESAVVAVLDREADYLIDGRVLTLTKGDRSLTYRAAPTP